MPPTNEEEVTARERQLPGTESASCDTSGEKKAARHSARRSRREPADYKFAPLFELEPFSKREGIEILKWLYRGLTLEDMVIPDEDEGEMTESRDDGA